MWSVFLLATLAAAEREVAVRAGTAGVVTCAAHDGQGTVLSQRLAVAGPGRWRWRSVSGEVLTCSGAGFEPISIAAAQPGLPASLARELWPARPVTLQARGPAIDTWIEWRRLDPSATVPVARRRMPVGDGVVLPVAGVHRVLRLYPDGFSPVSLFVPETEGGLTLRVPAPRPGGAVFGLLPPDALGPVELELSRGGRTEAIPVQAGRVFEASGLEPGTYGLTPRYRAGGLGRALTVVVRRGEVTEVALPAAEVLVAGRLTLGEDGPASGYTLIFENGGQSWTARTDEGGEYSLPLGPPGDYVISLPSAGRITTTFRRTFQAGEQTADFALSPAALHVTARREDGAPLDEAVEVSITSGQGQRISAQWEPRQEPEKRLVGMDLGEYQLTARGASGLVSLASVRVEVTSQEPLAEAELVLGRHAGRLEVVDERGMPLPDAQVEGPQDFLAPIGHGAFALGTVPIGEQLTIRAAGYEVAVHVLQPSDLPVLRVALSTCRPGAREGRPPCGARPSERRAGWRPRVRPERGGSRGRRRRRSPARSSW